ncbi:MULTISPECIES: hypothetical protein [unclassified Cupriavidus]|uniref:hypothetical protein n=1 Tax=unclassified Cupriavidus TaxID=2640874 RepID=UPI001C005536|nr:MULTISPECIES: hypothetical protein [unclassified Cupriavidus]MCA3187903.1 hypothetical protein [Cupriavidus sp.]MCA3189450.1 hypothetical protein [Cupriavidus sp.]MCA3195530.1 hypothetical protein [Cupriavidus sp.]MCA3201085.1 hypothetical protein [Cupriavidus sp.]MCA3207901.1 hypothetical protein [Cupriavidus sp.]
MTNVQPIFVPRDLQRVLRTERDAAMIVGNDLAADLMRLLAVAGEHQQDVYIAVLDDGRGKPSLVARVAGSAGDWTRVC